VYFFFLTCAATCRLFLCPYSFLRLPLMSSYVFSAGRTPLAHVAFVPTTTCFFLVNPVKLPLSSDVIFMIDPKSPLPLFSAAPWPR